MDLTALGPVVDVHTDGTNVWELQPGTLIRQTVRRTSARPRSGHLARPAARRRPPRGRRRPPGCSGSSCSASTAPSVQAYRAQTLDLVATLTLAPPDHGRGSARRRAVVADSAGISVVHPTGRTRGGGRRTSPPARRHRGARDGRRPDDREGGAARRTARAGPAADGRRRPLTATRGPEISSDAALVVTSAGQLWAGGRGPDGPVLTRLDAGGRGYACRSRCSRRCSATAARCWPPAPTTCSSAVGRGGLPARVGRRAAAALEGRGGPGLIGLASPTRRPATAGWCSCRSTAARAGSPRLRGRVHRGYVRHRVRRRPGRPAGAPAPTRPGRRGGAWAQPLLVALVAIAGAVAVVAGLGVGRPGARGASAAAARYAPTVHIYRYAPWHARAIPYGGGSYIY